MHFRELVSVAPAVRFTCFVYMDGAFRQWFPSKFAKGMNQLDQIGSELKKAQVPILDNRIYRVQPTEHNYMNVYLY